MIIQEDVTIHDLEKHLESVKSEESIARSYNDDGTAKEDNLGRTGHSEEWYKSWPINKGQAKCPTCGVAAAFKEIEYDESGKNSDEARNDSGDGRQPSKSPSRSDSGSSTGTRGKKKVGVS